MTSLVAQMAKNLPAKGETWVRSLGSISGSGRFPGEGNGNPPQYSCLENPMDRGAWWATVHGVAKSRTRLSDFTSKHVQNSFFYFPILQSSLPFLSPDFLPRCIPPVSFLPFKQNIHSLFTLMPPPLFSFNQLLALCFVPTIENHS